MVVNQKRYQERWKALPGSSSLARYQALLSLSPNLIRLIGSGILVSKPSSDGSRSSADALVRSAADFSYSAPQYAGDSIRIVGDAGGTWNVRNLCDDTFLTRTIAFIDPLFSSGVHLAMTSALSAAASICASIRGDCSETAAAAWYTRRFTLSYTR